MKTPQLMLGLKGWEGPATDPEGFFHTGDLGFYDKDGIVHFMEQVKKLTCHRSRSSNYAVIQKSSSYSYAYTYSVIEAGQSK